MLISCFGFMSHYLVVWKLLAVLEQLYFADFTSSVFQIDFSCSFRCMSSFSKDNFDTNFAYSENPT